MRTWIDVARLTQAKNLSGGLVAHSAPGLPLLLSEGMELALVPPVLDAPRRVRVSRVTPRGRDEALLHFAEVRDIETAQMLVGCRCLARRAELRERCAEDGAEPESFALLAGWTVADEAAGRVGVVLRVEERPAQSLLVVGRDDGEEVLVPLVEEFIVGIDERRELVELRCPEGLLDL